MASVIHAKMEMALKLKYIWKYWFFNNFFNFHAKMEMTEYDTLKIFNRRQSKKIWVIWVNVGNVINIGNGVNAGSSSN